MTPSQRLFLYDHYRALMTDNVHDTSPDSVQADRDRWKAVAQTGWQEIAELRFYLTKFLNGPLATGDLEDARKLLERTGR